MTVLELSDYVMEQVTAGKLKATDDIEIQYDGYGFDIETVFIQTDQHDDSQLIIRA